MADHSSEPTMLGDASASKPSSAADAAVPERIGRYVVLRELGSGAMGVVVVAYDPELDRQLAIKLIHPRIAGRRQAHARMLREAKGLARLSHPNVVQVYDAGTVDERVFIAMELVDGQPLSRWQGARERSVDEILAVYRDAGRGLAAAHEAGLVHRDFKPDNVLVDRLGRAKVLDFGLVRSVTEVDASGGDVATEPTVEVGLAGVLEQIETGPDSVEGNGETVVGAAAAPRKRTHGQSGAFGGHSSSELEIELTDGNQLMGTPAYMSPEQWRGTRADARSDQFSFCVALWEALHGQRPFAGRTIQTLATAVCSGDRVEGPARLPRKLAAALERGLAVDPAGRFGTMDGLLVELEREDWSRRSLPLAALALAAFAVLAWGAREQGAVEAGPSCAQAGLAVDTIWSPERRDAIAASFEATGQPVEATLRQLEARIGDYASRWRTAAEDNCAATRIREQQSSELFDLRGQCLTTKLEDLDALLEVFGEADAGTVDEAVLAVESLPGLLGCEPQRVRSSTAALPDDPERAATVSELRRGLAGARAYLDTGRFNDASERIDELEPRVAALDYAPLVAEFDIERGRLLARIDRHEDAAAALQRGYFTAVELHDDELALRGASWLAELEGAQRQRPEFANLWAEHARALLERDPSRYPDVAADLADTVSWNAYLAGDLDRARAEAQRGLDLLDAAELDAPMHRMALLLDRGAAEYGAGELRAAEASFTAALELAEATVGRDNAKATGALNNLAITYSAEGELERARELLQESVETRERALGPDNTTVAIGLSNLADIELELGHGTAALDAAKRGHEILLATLGRDQYATVIARQRLGLARGMTGRYEDATLDLRDALEVALTPPADESLAFELRLELAVVLTAAGDAEASAQALEQALTAAPTHWRELVIAGRYAKRIGQASLAETILEQGVSRAGTPEDPGSQRRLALAKLALAELALESSDPAAGAQRAALLLGPELDEALRDAPKLLAELTSVRAEVQSL